MVFVKVVGGIEIYNFCIQRLVHFYTRFWSFTIFNGGPAARLGSNAAARVHAPAGLGVRATRRPRPHAGRGVPLPHALHPEAPGSPPGRAHATDHAVPARCAPRTADPSAAPHRTRASRGGRATTTSPSSRRRHRGGLPIKTEHRPALRAPHRAAGRHCRRSTELACSPSFSAV
jgi:hypothetical protein